MEALKFTKEIFYLHEKKCRRELLILLPDETIREIVGYVEVKKLEDVENLRLVCRRFNAATEERFRHLALQIQDAVSLGRVSERISPYLPESRASFTAKCIRMFREMRDDVERRVSAACRWGTLAQQHLPSPILTIPGLMTVESAERAVEQWWIDTLTEYVPNQQAVIRKGGALDEMCNRLLAQPTLSQIEISMIVIAALNMDDAQVIRATFASGHIVRLTEENLEDIASSVLDRSILNCMTSCLFLAENSRGPREKHLFRQIWEAAAQQGTLGTSRVLKIFLQIVPPEQVSTYLSRAVVLAAQGMTPQQNLNTLQTLLDFEQSDLIVPEALGLALYRALFNRIEDSVDRMQILAGSKAFARISQDDLLRVFYAAERNNSTRIMDVLRTSCRSEELPPANAVAVKGLFYEYMRGTDWRGEGSCGVVFLLMHCVIRAEKQDPRLVSPRVVSLGLGLLGLGFLISGLIRKKMDAQNQTGFIWERNRLRDLGLSY